MSKVRPSLTYANVAATLALFLALTGGIAYAADKIGSDEIARNAIQSKHVDANAIRGADVAERTLRGAPVAGYERVVTSWQVPPDSRLFLNSQCPAGKVAVSGGYFADTRVEQQLGLVTGDTTYTVGISNPSTEQTAEVRVTVVCLQD